MSKCHDSAQNRSVIIQCRIDTDRSAGVTFNVKNNNKSMMARTYSIQKCYFLLRTLLYDSTMYVKMFDTKYHGYDLRYSTHRTF